MNVYGALDNLARIWCLEANIENKKGKAISDGRIGLGPKYIEVRESFSSAFQQCLTAADDWFEYLDSFRHAVAHRIPVYVPPKCVINGTVKFQPIMSHSLKEQKNPVYFHGQVIVDYATVIELGEFMLKELDALPR